MASDQSILVVHGMGRMKYFTSLWIGACIGSASSAFYMSMLAKESVSAVHMECMQKAEKIRYEASDYLNKYQACSTKYSECERGEK
jgi:hypothetical protein